MLREAVKAQAVGAAAAHDLNNELTIILNAVSVAMQKTEMTNPIYPLLVEARAAAQRGGWKASGLLNYSAPGIRVTAAPMESVIDD